MNAISEEKSIKKIRELPSSFKFIKKAKESPITTTWAPGTESDISHKVHDMLNYIELKKEKAVFQYAKKFDNWPENKNFLLTKEEIEAQILKLPQQVKDDIRWQMIRVKRFAQAQKNSIHEFGLDIGDGVTAGQRLIPIETVGCYIPGGRFSHISSAVMTIATAKVAGVDNIIATSPPLKGTQKIHPATLYAMYIAGADYIFCLGGVQAIATMAFGLFTEKPADCLVGPGNSYVAEAKRSLFGRCGIDLFAGPTEIAVIADETADPYIVATDLISQAEHGINSPAWCICIDEQIAHKILRLTNECALRLKVQNAGNIAWKSWAVLGEIVTVSNRQEAVFISDIYCAEHLEVLCKDLGWWLTNLRNYGSLFLGEETCVSFGDKVSGPNHVLPTKSTGRYTGGLSVHSYIKKVTWQAMTRINPSIPVRAARISRIEGMEGHAQSGDIRLKKYFPGKKFDINSKL